MTNGGPGEREGKSKSLLLEEKIPLCVRFCSGVVSLDIGKVKSNLSEEKVDDWVQLYNEKMSAP